MTGNLQRSEEGTIEKDLSHFVTKAVSCRYQINRGLAGVDTDRCHPFLGRGTAKKPILRAQVGVHCAVKRCQKVVPLIIDQKRTTLPCGKDFFVPCLKPCDALITV
jgi:hypothetical protein